MNRKTTITQQVTSKIWSGTNLLCFLFLLALSLFLTDVSAANPEKQNGDYSKNSYSKKNLLEEFYLSSLRLRLTPEGLNPYIQPLADALVSQLPLPDGDAPIIVRRVKSSFAVKEYTPILAAQASSPIIKQGKQISLNGRIFPVAWSQWQTGTGVSTGISDTAALQILGMELLSTNNPSIQPVYWFSSVGSTPFNLKAQQMGAYRYLDLTDFAKVADIKLSVVGDTLNIDWVQANIENIYPSNQPWGKQIVVNLDHSTFWQVSQAKNEGVITVDGIANPSLIERFPAPPPQLEVDKDNLLSIFPLFKPEPPPLIVEKSGTQTKLRVNIPDGSGLRVLSLPDPNRLVIDIRPDAMIERDILWAPGLRWQQKFMGLGASPTPLISELQKEEDQTNSFPVVLLEVDPRTPGISVQPIWSNPTTVEGTSPLINTASQWKASAAINGGFFNRNNQLPLGAIRRDGQWLSGPILGRAAIAWDNRGNVKIGRINLQETLTTSGGDRLPILFLNSGYVQAGIARYTPSWGATYTPLTDNEIIVEVENNLVTRQFPGGKAGENSFPIPANGYLLSLRADNGAASTLTVGTQVSIDSVTAPNDFNNYPQIIGAGPLLLQNSQIVLDPQAEKFSEAFNKQAASRSAIGTTAQGTLLIVAVHNRPGGSGPTLKEMAQLMQRLGAIDALNLDGGSSTSLYLGGQLLDRSPATAARVHNGIGIFLSPTP